MTAVTVREFAYNPSAMFARAQRGETIEVTKHGDVVAVLVPPPRGRSQYDDLVARGLLKPRPPGAPKAGDWDEFVHIEVPDEVDPLGALAEQRADRDVLEVLDEAGR